MRGLALAAGVAIAALAVPAQARDGEGYVGIDAGIAFPQDTKIDVSGVKDAVVVKNKKGFNFDAVLGYDWGMIRTEAEVGRASWKAKSITSGAAFTVRSEIIRAQPATHASPPRWLTRCSISAATAASGSTSVWARVVRGSAITTPRQARPACTITTTRGRGKASPSCAFR